MGFIIKPIKLVVFAFAVFGFLQLKFNEKRLLDYLHMIFAAKQEESLQSQDEKHIDISIPKPLISNETLKELDEITEKTQKHLNENIGELKKTVPNLIPLKPPPAELMRPKQMAKANAPKPKVIPGTLIPQQSIKKPSHLKSELAPLSSASHKVSKQDKQALDDLLETLP